MSRCDSLRNARWRPVRGSNFIGSTPQVHWNFSPSNSILITLLRQHTTLLLGTPCWPRPSSQTQLRAANLRADKQSKHYAQWLRRRGGPPPQYFQLLTLGPWTSHGKNCGLHKGFGMRVHVGKKYVLPRGKGTRSDQIWGENA
jgi:hypothetical protein